MLAFLFEVLMFVILSVAAISVVISVNARMKKLSEKEKIDKTLSDFRQVAAEAIEIRDKALSRLTMYETDANLEINCPEIRDLDNPLTIAYVKALRQLKETEEKLELEFSTNTAKKLFEQARHFAYTVAQAELPMMRKMLATNDLTESQRIEYEDRVIEIDMQISEFESLN